MELIPYKVKIKEEEKRCEALAREILEKKQRVKHYLISGKHWQEDTFYDDSFFIPLSDEEVVYLQQLVAKYEGFSLSELEDDIPFYDKLCPNCEFGCFEPTSVDFEKIAYYYTFQAVILDTPESAPHKELFEAGLKDEDYVKLLAWRLYDRHASFNMLASELPELYLGLTRCFIDLLGTPVIDVPQRSPFLIFTDEVDRDVFNAVGEPDFFEIIVEGGEGSKRYNLCLNIKEKILEYSLHTNFSNETIAAVDAIAVQNAFGASCYRDLYEKIKEEFGHGPEDFKGFRDFLDSKGLGYKMG